MNHPRRGAADRPGRRASTPPFLTALRLGTVVPRPPRRWRLLWSRVQAEDIPRLAAFFVVAVVVSGYLLFRIESPRNEAFRTVEDGFWWAIVTLTTTGYGDKYPITTGGRLFAGAAMLLGMGVVAIVTAKIATVMVARRIKEGRGLTDAKRLSGHVVMLGWRPDMAQLIEEVLRINPGLPTRGLLLVNLAEELAVEELKTRFPGLHYVRGDIVDALTLQRANLAKAAKVVIMADVSTPRSDVEVDARTVMANLAVKTLAPEAYTAAEVLDAKYIEHLRMGGCDEVIQSREYSRSLLVGAAVAAGVTHVMHELLDFADMRGLLTEPIPSTFVGRRYGELFAALKAEGQLLIGLLQNTGRSVEIKREALREAQKTANVHTLVENLRRVKELRPNKPLLCPPDDTPIPPHALAIVIGRPRTEAAP